MAGFKLILESLGQFEAIHPRHHHIAYHQVEVFFLRHGQAHLPIGSHLEVKATFQFRSQEVAHIIIILYQQDGLAIERLIRICFLLLLLFILRIYHSIHRRNQYRIVLYQEV